MKRIAPPLPIAQPCPERWEEMQGSESKRFCSECQLHVHNLSAMREGDRSRFIKETGGRACIAYVLHPDGTMEAPGRFPCLERLVTRGWQWAAWLLALVFPVAFAGCATRRTLGRTATPPPTSVEEMRVGRAPSTGAMVRGRPAPISHAHEEKSSPQTRDR
jgi:hypothetical protein